MPIIIGDGHAHAGHQTLVKGIVSHPDAHILVDGECDIAGSAKDGAVGHGNIHWPFAVVIGVGVVEEERCIGVVGGAEGEVVGHHRIQVEAVVHIHLVLRTDHVVERIDSQVDGFGAFGAFATFATFATFTTILTATFATIITFVTFIAFVTGRGGRCP